SDVSTTATASGDGYTLNGVKTVVANGGTANKFVVSARTSGEQFDHSGVSLFLVDATAPGVDVKAYKMMDGQSAATLTLTDVAVDQGQLLNAAGGGMGLIEQVMPQILIGLSAEALGIMATLNTLTVEYSKTRQQFGAPIGSFQVLQHRMVDTFMGCEQTKSMLYRGLCESKSVAEGETDAVALAKTVHALKATVARYGKIIGEEAIQLHGGIGMTDELNIGHYVKRLMMINTSYGDGDFHQKAFNQLSYSA
ncbi:MAG TPA: pimeloyl-CoA dehydrogenase small subunit, partial [Porticoccaceae bacterium]|nr:pimeloyl-CoA dehydrogenase small subunit [Porticoccaceae bacterium]